MVNNTAITFEWAKVQTEDPFDGWLGYNRSDELVRWRVTASNGWTAEIVRSSEGRSVCWSASIYNKDGERVRGQELYLRLPDAKKAVQERIITLVDDPVLVG